MRIERLALVVLSVALPVVGGHVSPLVGAEDWLTFLAWATFEVSDVYTKAEVDAMIADLDARISALEP